MMLRPNSTHRKNISTPDNYSESHRIVVLTPQLPLHTVQSGYGLSNAPSVRLRVQVAVALGLVCGLMSFASTFRAGFRGQDFGIFWTAARILLSGGNPYHAIVLADGGPAFFYPIPALVLVAPFAALPVHIAGPGFVALSCGLLAFVVTRDGWWRLVMFLSGSMLCSVTAAGWSPLVTVAFFATGAMWLGAVKPNIGLAMLAHRPSLRAALIMLAVAVVSLVVLPTWPLDWLASVRASRVHFAPIVAPGGFLLLLAALKWRRPEARLLLAMALLPSSPVVYEALPLFVIPATWRQMLILSATTMGAYLSTRTYAGDVFSFMQHGRSLVVWTCYLPALVMVLRRPNVAA